MNNILDGEGCFSPERSGTVPVGDLVKMCFSGKYTQKEVYKKICGNGGFNGYLHTNDAREVGKMAESGDALAKQVWDAFFYQIAKDAGAMAAVLHGKVDQIILTGGIAYNPFTAQTLTDYDVFATVAGTPTYDMGTNSRYTTPGTYILQNTDKLITNSSYHRDYTKGGKTGSLGEWQNFAGWHTQDGISYISVVLNVPYEADPDQARPALYETAQLMDVIFDSFTIAAALDPTQPITEVRVAYSTQTDTVMLYPADNMMTLLPAAGGAALTEPVFNVPDELAAPIRQGDVVGTVTLTIQGEVIGTADLIAGSDVSRNQVLYTLSRVSLFFSSTYFKVVIALTIFVVGCYGIYIAGRVLLASRKTH